jgi:hypothetical protein
MERDRDATVWTRRQLDSTDANANATVMTRLATSSTWLQANLVNRDVVFIGFWSDWRYLNDVLQSALATSTPTMVVVVDPASPEVLQQKAPELWNWCHQGGIDFFHERQSGKEFLADLRRIFSQRLLERVLIDSLQLFDAMSKGAVQPDTTFADITSNEELYQIRKDMSSAPRRDVPRKKRPDPSMREAGAIHLLVRQKGGRLQGSRYLLNTHTIRVLNGGHRPMNRVRAEFGNDGANVEDEMIICSDAFDDGGVPSDLMGRSEVTSIVRSVSRSTWLTWQQARGRDLI